MWKPKVGKWQALEHSSGHSCSLLMEPAVVQQEVHQNISKELGAYDMKNINELRALKKEIYIWGPSIWRI